ncbi:MAG TPA: hypothetical protein VK553_03210 [Candidatus Nitrosopolaris rasttigaisensis]|nr:hypothetical protein [Candidatus Nitrosopolaris rasttigaisensis]
MGVAIYSIKSLWLKRYYLPPWYKAITKNGWILLISAFVFVGFNVTKDIISENAQSGLKDRLDTAQQTIQDSAKNNTKKLIDALKKETDETITALHNTTKTIENVQNQLTDEAKRIADVHMAKDKLAFQFFVMLRMGSLYWQLNMETRDSSFLSNPDSAKALFFYMKNFQLDCVNMYQNDFVRSDREIFDQVGYCLDSLNAMIRQVESYTIPAQIKQAYIVLHHIRSDVFNHLFEITTDKKLNLLEYNFGRHINRWYIND